MRSDHLTFMVTLYLIKLSPGLQVAHPNLYYSAGDVARLRQQAHTTHHEIYASLIKAADDIKKEPLKFLPPRNWTKFAGKWNEMHGNNFCALAMYCVLNEQDQQARDIAFQFFDAFVSLPNWRVTALFEDDVPVSHSLVAMATAYDFLYEYLDANRRSMILRKISDVSKELYERSLWIHWGKQYIQNHVASNYVAFLTGALVVERYNSEATKWKERAHEMLNRTMFLLSFIKDGSLDEGVAYGSYTTRSLTQYIFLAKRHLGVDLTDNIWLREHFWFMYRTILPGFRETIGIGDSNEHWFYGPESQLVFLDNYVMRNGYGNWLASRIRKLRNQGAVIRSLGQRYCTLHTEFFFYDPTILEKEPPNSKTPQLHVFSDWGVVTYGGGILDSESEKTRNTFVSFKSSVLHGKVVNDVVRTKPYKWIKGWRSFNPGHEHPDQGSFVFAPNGVPFITECLYGPKYTWLDNVLLFGPTKKPACSGSYEGQIGDCGKWLDFKNNAIWEAEGEVVAASEVDGMVFMSGEISKWYSSSLGLTSVYRAVILLNPGVLLVIDHIGKTSKSQARYVGAVFHHRGDAPFELRKDPFGETFAAIVLNKETYQVLWTNSITDQSMVRVESAQYRSGSLLRTTHYLNITTKMKQTHTRLAYVFAAPGNRVTRPKLEAETNGLHASLEVNGILYHVAMVTNYKTSQSRGEFLGFDGFAKLAVGDGHVVRFGPDKKASYEGVAEHVVRRMHVSNNNLTVLFVWVSVLILLLLLRGSRRRLFRCCVMSNRQLAFIMAAMIWLTIFVI